MSNTLEEKDIEETTEDEEKNIKTIEEITGLTLEEQAFVIKQVQDEFKLGDELTQKQRSKALKRLKLFNNQKRDQKKVGDPLLFTVFMTVFAALYDDKLGVEFQGREEGDDEHAENLNALAKNDYRIMKKDELDYNWGWDAAFFGRGFLLLNDFDRRAGIMCPVAEIIDPMTFVRDPKATSVNGDQRGRGALRFWGREMGMSMYQMKAHPSFFNLKGLKKGKKDVNNLLGEAEEARREAKDLQILSTREEALDGNYEHDLLEFWTHYKGKKVIVVLAEGRKRMIRFQYLTGPDDEPVDQWSLQDRTIFPMAHDFDGVSIPDLIEDKQRARSVMINLGMESAKADLYPMYAYDKTRIKNTGDLKFGFNKFVGVDGEVSNVIAPIQKSLFHSQVNLILDILDTAAQKAVAAPEVAQGVQPKQDRTLGESQMVIAGTSIRHSLSAKIFGWSERRFWQQWYYLYKKYFKNEIDKKVIRIEGPLNPIWRSLTRENIISRIDPDVIVESRSMSEFNRQKRYQEFSVFAQIAMQDPAVNRRYINRKLGKILGMKKGEMTLMFPPTIDEINAEVENQQLNENKFVEINPYDEDIVHIEIHNKAADKKAKMAHIEGHRLMMMKKKENAELFQPVGEQPMEGFSPVSQPGGASRPIADSRTRGQPPVNQEVIA